MEEFCSRMLAIDAVYECGVGNGSDSSAAVTLVSSRLRNSTSCCSFALHTELPLCVSCHEFSSQSKIFISVLVVQVTQRPLWLTPVPAYVVSCVLSLLHVSLTLTTFWAMHCSSIFQDQDISKFAHESIPPPPFSLHCDRDVLQFEHQPHNGSTQCAF